MKNTFIISLLVLTIVFFLKAEPLTLGAKNKPIIDRVNSRFEIANISDEVRQTVVSIKTKSKIKNGFKHPLESFFFNPRFKRQDDFVEKESLGSGVIISESGYILTNNHVVQGASDINISLFDGREFEAEIVGLDKESDVAVIKIKDIIDQLPVAYIGDSDGLRVGEKIIAIGSPFGLNHSVSVGIVSALNITGRGIASYENFIQTDAAINPGNSGGALVNYDGELVGINTAIISKSGGFNGIGFAIPINMANRIALDLINNGEVKRGWLGVGIQTLTKNIRNSLKYKGTGGVLVSQVVSDSPAKKGGLVSGDIITKVGGVKIKSVDNLKNEIAKARPETTVPIEYYRNGIIKKAEIKLTSNKNDVSGDLIYREFGFALDSESLEVIDIREEGLAQRSGLRFGDKLLGVNNISVAKLEDVKRAILKDAKFTLLYISRGSSEYFLGIER